MAFSGPTYGAAKGLISGVSSGLVSAELNEAKTEFTYTYTDGTVLKVPVTQPPLDTDLVEEKVNEYLDDHVDEIKGEPGEDGVDGRGIQILASGQTVADILPTTDMAFSFTEGASDVSYYSRTQSDLKYVKETEKGVSNGVAVLDSNGKLAWSQMPTSIYYIAGAIDASNEHQLPDASNHTDGAQIIVTSEGYVEQSTTMTLAQGDSLTEFEAYSANTLISAGYTFTLKSGTTTLGTVTSFETNRVNLSNSTSISLPYTADLTALSVPATVQVPCASGDVFMLIDGHWQHLSNSTYVTSVNNKTGAVVLTLNELGGTKQWYGYQADYDAIETKDPTMDYNIYEE